MNNPQVYALAARQSGLIARRQLRAAGMSKSQITAQLAARRWTALSPVVISTFTGELSWLQRCWFGVLHAGSDAIVGGIAAATYRGLKNWHRDTIDILVADNVVLDPIDGIRWVRTRRTLNSLRDTQSELPTARIEPALLIYGAADRSPRTAVGCLAAAVQQRLTTPARLTKWVDTLMPLRRAQLLRASLDDLDGGAESLGEIDAARAFRAHGITPPDRQTHRRDASGRDRYLDCRWRRRDGRKIVLEVDGGFHMDAEHWQADIARSRDLAAADTLTVRCTTLELRTEPETVAAALIRLGVPRRPPRGRVTHGSS